MSGNNLTPSESQPQVRGQFMSESLPSMNCENPSSTNKTNQTFITEQLRGCLKAVMQLLVVNSRHGKNVGRIHQLRTESSRADAALRLFANWLPQRRANRMRKSLAKLRHRAGTVRDLDVAQSVLRRQLTHFPKAFRSSLRKKLESMRQQRHCEFRNDCRKSLQGGIKKRTQSLLQKYHWRPAEQEPTLHEFSPRAIDRLLAEFIPAVDSLRNTPEQLHAVRILGRRLRYSLEIVQESLPSLPAHVIGQRFTKIQETLGRTNDEVVAVRLLNAVKSECRRNSDRRLLHQAIGKVQSTLVVNVLEAIQAVGDFVSQMQSEGYFDSLVASDPAADAPADCEATSAS